MPTTRINVPVGEKGEKVSVDCESSLQIQRIIKVMSEGKRFPSEKALTSFISSGAIPNRMISVKETEMALSK
ncbi:MAG: hypothetical protein WC666_03000 [Candidatus Paceibacterota bacterium]|jgi:hypothetical protein